MVRVLILDDDENRHREFDRILPDVSRLHVYTAAQAISALRDNAPYDLVCLDHDLSDHENQALAAEPGDGTEVALFINLHLEHSHYPKRVMIHSWNAPGRQRMENLIRAVGIPVIVKPFHV
jgi:CheY-like chemotaxis protein